MAKDCSFGIRVKFAWWVKPYIVLAQFGLCLGLPLNREIIVKDILRGIKFKVITNVGC